MSASKLLPAPAALLASDTLVPPLAESLCFASCRVKFCVPRLAMLFADISKRVCATFIPDSGEYIFMILTALIEYYSDYLGVLWLSMRQRLLIRNLRIPSLLLVMSDFTISMDNVVGSIGNKAKNWPDPQKQKPRC